VREALRVLQQEGLVVEDGRGRRSVPHFDIVAFEDIYRGRAAIERLGAMQACERASADAIERLRASWSHPPDGNNAYEDGGYELADERFHNGVAELSGNLFLVDALSRNNDRIRIIRLVDFSRDERIEITRREHGAILDAIEARSPERAGRLLFDHVERSMANVRELVPRALTRIYLGSEH
jgi:DNA-binding GntR family transcriptional regulator